MNLYNIKRKIIWLFSADIKKISWKSRISVIVFFILLTTFDVLL